MVRTFLPHSLAVASLAIQVSVTVWLFAIARAPGWHRVRAFGWVVLTAGFYSAVYAYGTSASHPLPAQAVHWHLSIVLGTLHAAAWCRFAWAPDARSWGDVPPWLYRTVIGVLGAVVAVAVSGRVTDIAHPVHMVIPSMGIDNLQPRTSTLGGIALLAIGVLYVVTAAGLVRRRREPGFTWVLAGYGAFLVCVVLEAIIAHFGWPLVFPAPLGFIVAIVPISWQLQRQFSSDAERLAWLSSSLRGQLASRTEERDVARNALVRQEQLLSIGRLAHGVGHQLSNPLQHMALALHELQRLPPAVTDAAAGDGDGASESRKYMHEIAAGIARMQEVVGRLRDVTDLESRHDVAFPLARAIRTATALVTMPHPGAVHIHTTVPCEDFCVLGDERAIVRCLAAVMLNAVEAATRLTGGAARVDVRMVQGPDGTAGVEVRDSGPGFPAEVLAHMGEPFVPGADKLGLGLHAVHRIVHAHGGTVTAGNLPAGGALVAMLFPSAESRLTALKAPPSLPTPRPATSLPAAPAAPAPAHPASASAGAPATVLIVDDELLVRQAFVRLLERQGYRVLAAEHGREAVDVLARSPVDLVVTDLMMPEMSGVELAQHLATHYPVLRQRLVVVCGGAVTQDAVAFVATPGLRVIEKPVAPADFLRAVQEALPLTPPRAGATITA